MKQWIAYLTLTLIFVIFAATIDEAIGRITLGALRFTVRVAWLFIVLFVLGLISRPSSS